MKKILLLLLFTIASYGQAVFDEGIQITGNTNSTTATKVNVQEANGKVNTKTINTAFNKNFGLNTGDVVGATTLLNQYGTTPIDWTATTFSSGQVVFYGGKQWIAKTATVAGDVPAVSLKWEEITFEALANKTAIVDATPTDGSNNAVSSNGVFDALSTKAPISSVHNPVTLGAANGLSLSNQQLSLGLASSGVTGALSGTDWNTFNGKFNTPTGLTTNYLPKWNGSGFGNSSIFDNGTNIGIGTTNPTANLTVKGAYSVGSSIPTNWALLSAGRVGVAKNNKGLYFDIFNDYAEVSTYDWSLGQAYPMVFQGNGGNSMFGTNVDNGSKVQVNGTISASPATTANQVVVKSQLDAVAARPYKVYTALLSQIGNAAPTATVLENTLGGTVVWSRTGTGVYTATLNGAFPLGKTTVMPFFGTINGGVNLSQTISGVRIDNNSVGIRTSAGGTLTDVLLLDATIEIRVYN